MTPDAYFKEWAFLHKTHSRALSEQNHPTRKRIEKRILELKPLYSEMLLLRSKGDSAPTTTTEAPQTIPNAIPAAEHHMSLQFYIVTGTAKAAILSDRAFNLWITAKTFKRQPSTLKMQNYYRMIETIVSNLLYGQASNHDGVRFSRDRKVYAASSRYRPSIFNERFLTVMDDLDSIGVVQQIKGDRLKPTLAQRFFPDEKATKTYGLKQSYIVPGKALMQLQADLSFTPSMHDVSFINEGREVLILKKGEGSQLLEYRDEDFPDIEKCRAQMHIINDMLLHAGELLNASARSLYDQRRRLLVRRFTHASTESGGRLWEGFWINGMKRDARPDALRIRGESTVELDFSNMIVHLAYFVAEKPAPTGDQYIIPGLDPESRPGVKLVLGALFFDSNRNRDRLPKGAAELFTARDRKKGWKYIYQAIRTHHYELRAYLDRGLGHYLQFLESQVIVNVLLRCARGRIVALPIHDCIIVPQSKMIQARHYMRVTVRHMFGKDASIPVMVKGLEEAKKRVA